MNEKIKKEELELIVDLSKKIKVAKKHDLLSQVTEVIFVISVLLFLIKIPDSMRIVEVIVSCVILSFLSFFTYIITLEVKGLFLSLMGKFFKQKKRYSSIVKSNALFLNFSFRKVKSVLEKLNDKELDFVLKNEREVKNGYCTNKYTALSYIMSDNYSCRKYDDYKGLIEKIKNNIKELLMDAESEDLINNLIEEMETNILINYIDYSEDKDMLKNKKKVADYVLNNITDEYCKCEIVDALENRISNIEENKMEDYEALKLNKRLKAISVSSNTEKKTKGSKIINI